MGSTSCTCCPKGWLVLGVSAQHLCPCGSLRSAKAFSTESAHCNHRRATYPLKPPAFQFLWLTSVGFSHCEGQWCSHFRNPKEMRRLGLHSLDKSTKGLRSAKVEDAKAWHWHCREARTSFVFVCFCLPACVTDGGSAHLSLSVIDQGFANNSQASGRTTVHQRWRTPPPGQVSL